MRRVLAILCIAVGTTLFGVAAGFVYLDQREIQILYIRAMAGGEISTAEQEALESHKTDWITKAIVVGPPGAGLLLAGLAMLLLEFRWFRGQGIESAAASGSESAPLAH